MNRPDDPAVAGFTSTGSKHPRLLYGVEPMVAVEDGLPVRVARARGAMVTDNEGREYLDFIMALGAVALGYGHPDVTRAAVRAVEEGGVGPLAPVLEEQVAARLVTLLPPVERVRFLKTGAEAVAAAVRLARACTGRDLVIGCGYHGWLDWCSDGPGVPSATRSLFTRIPFNDPQSAREAIRAAGDRLACVVLEPVVEAWPDPEWLRIVREETARTGALLVLDEIKTAFRVHRGGAAGRFGIPADLVVVGKALANGFPLAAVGGRASVMEAVGRAWISSTLATEWVSLAAALATLDVMASVDLPAALERSGQAWCDGLASRAGSGPLASVRGVPAMSLCVWATVESGNRVVRAAARHGLLLKRDAYNFTSLAHGMDEVTRALSLFDLALEDAGRERTSAG